MYEHKGFNQIINEEVEASNDNIHSEKIYLNGTKFVSKLKLFSDDNSISSDLREFKARDVLINEANLVLHLDNNIHKSNYEFLPKRLYIYSYKDGLPIEDYNKDFSINFSATAVNANKFLFGGILQYDSNNLPTSYKFNITNHISNIVRHDSLNIDLGLTTTSNIEDISLKNGYFVNQDKLFLPSPSITLPFPVAYLDLIHPKLIFQRSLKLR